MTIVSRLIPLLELIHARAQSHAYAICLPSGSRRLLDERSGLRSGTWTAVEGIPAKHHQPLPAIASHCQPFEASSLMRHAFSSRWPQGDVGRPASIATHLFPSLARSTILRLSLKLKSRLDGSRCRMRNKKQKAIQGSQPSASKCHGCQHSVERMDAVPT
ncbi:hypothetical protein B0T10DRAFT_180394 [Thelonectria olida]|uniref:Uncharacterized protein n=1 Tax=Thelonectria olida TaxID=1576542 RepID=A0A9P8WI12_9HYPO|nr:hypothetical protein B0T10DRAFT_180394 [Thelonectria olida]